MKQQMMVAGFLALLCLGIAAPDGAAVEAPEGVAIPTTPAGQRASAYLAGYHGGADTMRQFFEASRPASVESRMDTDSRMKIYERIHEMWGALEVHVITHDTPHEVAFLAHAAHSDEWLELRFKVEAEEPYGVLSIGIAASGPPDQVKRSYDDWKDLPDLLARVTSDTEVPAFAVAVVRGGVLVDQAAVGVRAMGGAEKVTVNDRFHIGSVTKSMTATMIGRLVESGDLKWDLTLGEALDDVDMRPEYRDVTLEQLLQHRGGIQGYQELEEGAFDEIAAGGGSSVELRARFVASVLQEPPVNVPGTEMAYSNAGYAIAGHLAERATGLSWEELLRRNVFRPLRLKTATFGWPATEAGPDQPRGHFSGHGEMREMRLDEYDLGPYLAAAGDINCTAADLARYAGAHLAGLRGEKGPLSVATVRRLHTAPEAGPGAERYAAGWGIETTRSGGEVHWHNGSAGTFNALVRIFPEEDLVVVVLANTGFELADLPSEQIIRAVRARLAEQG